MIGGVPAILFYDSTEGSLKFIKATAADGSAWPSAAPVVLDGAGATGRNAGYDVKGYFVNGALSGEALGWVWLHHELQPPTTRTVSRRCCVLSAVVRVCAFPPASSGLPRHHQRPAAVHSSSRRRCNGLGRFSSRVLRNCTNRRGCSSTLIASLVCAWFGTDREVVFVKRIGGWL